MNNFMIHSFKLREYFYSNCMSTHEIIISSHTAQLCKIHFSSSFVYKFVRLFHLISVRKLIKIELRFFEITFNAVRRPEFAQLR